MRHEILSFSNTKCRVGESPVWDAEHARLLWSDIPAGKIYARDANGGPELQWTLPEPVGAFGLADDGRLVVGLASGVALFNMSTNTLDWLAKIETEHSDRRSQNRLNDGKVGPDGAFWVGSMHKNPTGGAALWRVTGDGRATRKISGLTTSNGLAFSSDGKRLYHSDSGIGWIDSWKLDPTTGALSDRNRFAGPSDAVGCPDGAATDEKGRYWSADVGNGRLNCFEPDGTLALTIDVPPKMPSMPCFGGDDLRSLYITSIRRPDDFGDHCGEVFMLRVDVPGVPLHRFTTAKSCADPT